MSFETLDRELWGLGTKGQAKSACTSADGLVSKYTSTFEEVTSQRFCFSTGGPPSSCTTVPPATSALSQCPARLPSAASYPSPNPAQQLEAGAKGGTSRAASPRDTGLEHETSK